MSQLHAQLQRRARASLCAMGDATPVTSPNAPAFSGWKDYVPAYEGVQHVRTAALAPVSYALADAVERELTALGCSYTATADGPTFDGAHVTGYTLTMPRADFEKTLQPQLEQWRVQELAARSA